MDKRKRGAKKRGRGPITYQNKDITSKVLADNFKGKSLEAYGLQLPPVVDVRPTNLPAIEAKELRLDNIFILEDGSWSIIDYESEYDEKNKVKYLGYVAQLAKRMYNDDKEMHRIRIIVIYTADVKRGTTNAVLDLGASGLRIDEAFLSDLDSHEIRERVAGKLERGEALDDIDLAAINVFADKIITETDRDRIRRLIEMTKLGREFWEDAFNSGLKQGTEQGIEQGIRLIVEKMLRKGSDPDAISELTGLAQDEIRKIEEQLLQNA